MIETWYDSTTTILFQGNFVFLSSLLLSVAAIVAPQPASNFTLYKKFETYTLSVDTESIDFAGRPEAPLVLLDIEMKLDNPITFNKSKLFVKRYHNSLAVDCVHDRVFVVVARVFDPTNKLLKFSSEPIVIQNPHEPTSVTTEVINLVCPPILDGYKKQKPEPTVTFPKGLPS